MLKLIPIFSFLIFFTCCETDVNPTSVENPPISLTKDSIQGTSFDILIFKKEKKVELWENKTKNLVTFVKKMDLLNGKRLLLGSFVSTSGKMELILPGNSYQNKISAYAKPLQHNLLDFSERILPITNLISAKDQEESTSLLSNSLLHQVIIFPNDPRSSGTFDPCVNCPHWMVEIYGNLEMHLKNYPIPNS